MRYEVVRSTEGEPTVVLVGSRKELAVLSDGLDVMAKKLILEAAIKGLPDPERAAQATALSARAAIASTHPGAVRPPQPLPEKEPEVREEYGGQLALVVPTRLEAPQEPERELPVSVDQARLALDGVRTAHGEAGVVLATVGTSRDTSPFTHPLSSRQSDFSSLVAALSPITTDPRLPQPTAS